MAREMPVTSWQQSIIVASRTFVTVVIVLALYFGRAVLMPIALAILLTILLSPVVRSLQRLGLGRIFAVLLAVSLAGITLTTLGGIGSRQITHLVSELPENSAKIIKKLRTLKSLVSGQTAVRFEQMIEDISHELKLPPKNKTDGSAEDADPDTADRAAQRVVLATDPIDWNSLTGHLGTAVEIMAMLAFTAVLLVFFLMEREGLRDRIVSLAGKARRTMTSKALVDATSRVSRYIVMVEIVNGSFGVLLTIGLALLGVPYAVLWGCVAALLRFIPYIGPWIGAVFPITISLAMSEGWWQPLAVFGFVMTLELVTNNVIEPILFGHTTGVAPIALLISAAFWLYIWGPIGLILSAPFTLSLVVIGKNIPQLSFLNTLLGDQPALTEDMGFYQRMLVGDQHEAMELINQRLREPHSDQVFDELMVPVLNYVKHDCRKSYLNNHEGDSVLGALEHVVGLVDLNQSQSPQADTHGSSDQGTDDSRPRIRILGCGADGDFDRSALLMLQKLLDPKMWELELVAAETLTSELVDKVASDPPGVIALITIPPGGVTRARYLCKKLRTGTPETPILVGRLGPQRIDQMDRERLMEAGVSGLVTTLVEMRQWLDARHAIFGGSDVATSRRG